MPQRKVTPNNAQRKTKCGKCGQELIQKNLKSHFERKHPKERPYEQSTSADIRNALVYRLFFTHYYIFTLYYYLFSSITIYYHCFFCCCCRGLEIMHHSPHPLLPAYRHPIVSLQQMLELLTVFNQSLVQTLRRTLTHK